MMKKILNTLEVVLFALILAACTNSAEQNNEEEPETALAQISVEGTGEIGDIKVFIDDEEGMEVKNNQQNTIELPLLIGTHTIQLKGQEEKSNVLGFEVESGEKNRFSFYIETSGSQLSLKHSTEKIQASQQEVVDKKMIEMNKEETKTNEIVEKQPVVSLKNEYLQKLNKIEEELAEIEYLYENGNTIEMKKAESIRYERWDAALNEIYGVLKTQLSKNEMDALRQEQRQWINYRDRTAKEESLAFEGGTMESLQYISTLARLTKERCYELVNQYMK